VIVTLLLKDADRIDIATANAVRQAVSRIDGLSVEEQNLIIPGRLEQLRKELEPWIKDGEYIKVEIDTELRSAKVLSRNDDP